MKITDAMLDEYSDERIEVDDRPVLIDPGIYMGHMMNWEKSFNPMFRKYSLVMNFKIRDEVIPLAVVTTDLVESKYLTSSCQEKPIKRLRVNGAYGCIPRTLSIHSGYE